MPTAIFHNLLNGAPSKSARWTYALFTFMAIFCFYKAFRFHYPHFIFTYPFISYDGYQWMGDGLHYLDRNIEATHRNPALPLMFSFMRTFDLVHLFPYVVSALTLGFYGAAYWLVRAFSTPAVSRLTVLWFFFVFRIHNFYDFVLSDPWCVDLIVLGLGFLVRAPKNPKMLLGAAFSFGLALNYQFAPVFASPALLWFVFKGLGIEWLKRNRRIIGWSIAVFLILALPQFIYKWIAFGSPLYSHVTHFPLVRLHLFGLFYYGVNFFAFLGWPLACVVMLGAKNLFQSREPGRQLIHLFALCMFLFWIVGYLWLDVRFLLYLLPAWVVYAAKGIEDLELINWLSFSKKTPIQRAAIVAAIYFALSLSSMRIIAFDSSALPITPQMILRFSSVPISEWGVATLTTDKITTEHSDTDSSLFNLTTYFKFYKGYARGNKTHSDEFSLDVEEIAVLVEKETTSLDRIGLCGTAGSVFGTKMAIFFTLGRNLGDCTANNKFHVATRTEAATLGDGNSNYDKIWQGSELALFKRQVP